MKSRKIFDQAKKSCRGWAVLRWTNRVGAAAPPDLVGFELDCDVGGIPEVAVFVNLWAVIEGPHLHEQIIGGNTFARNKSGNYARARTKPVNPRSDLQSEARVRIQTLAEYWHSAVMSNEERGAWEAYAAAVGWTNKLGETIHLSGYNHFIRSNASLLAAGGAIVEPGPEEQALPEADETLAVAGDNGTQFLTVAFDIAKLWALETGGYLLVEMSMPQLHTRNSAGSHWRVAAAIAGIDTTGVSSPQNILAPFTLTT
ncbi:unnamed protein product, partial [marine sediment metagenome]